MSYHNITQTDAKVQFYRKTKFKLPGTVDSKDIQEFHDAFLVSQNGICNMFIPEKEYKKGTGKYFLTSKYHWVFGKIDNYCLHQHGDLFAFHCVGEKYWRFLSLENFERGFSDNIIDSMLLDLPTIPYSREQTVCFKEEFQSLYDIEATDVHFAIFSIGHTDFLIKIHIWETSMSSSGLKIESLGKAEILPGGNGKYFKSVDQDGTESMYFLGYKEDLPEKIVNFAPDEYPDENFTAYWLKDKNGMIWGAKFISVSEPSDYQIRLKAPVTKMEFIRQTHETDEHGKEDGVAEFWKITTSENHTAILLFSRSSEKFVIFNPNDFLD